MIIPSEVFKILKIEMELEKQPTSTKAHLGKKQVKIA
jgi:hypothetical protein